MDEVSAEGEERRVLSRPAQEYVRDLVQAGEIDQGLRHVGSSENPSFHVQVAGEIQVLLKCLPFLWR